ncbi:MAG: hypothetical protein J5858_08270 [Lentisphaeria bacterium]|nr:hypothetical protein [Lentisphaeria bacterium]
MGNSQTVIAALAAVCMGSLSAVEIFRIDKPEDFTKPTEVTQENDILVVKGKASLYSAEALKLDPAKKYKLSGEFRLRSGTPVQVRLGYLPLDRKNRGIYPLYVNTVPDTETEIAASVRRGGKVISVKDASKWKNTNALCYVAFNAKDDFSDLPNRSVIPIAKNGIRQTADGWEITLKQPLKMNMEEGTKVRQHIDGATCIWNTGVATLNDRWVVRTGLLSGIVKVGTSANKLWPGTGSVRIHIRLLGGKTDSVVEIRNVKVEEIGK